MHFCECWSCELCFRSRPPATPAQGDLMLMLRFSTTRGPPTPGHKTPTLMFGRMDSESEFQRPILTPRIPIHLTFSGFPSLLIKHPPLDSTEGVTAEGVRQLSRVQPRAAAQPPPTTHPLQMDGAWAPPRGRDGITRDSPLLCGGGSRGN